MSSHMCWANNVLRQPCHCHGGYDVQSPPAWAALVWILKSPMTTLKKLFNIIFENTHTCLIREIVVHWDEQYINNISDLSLWPNNTNNPLNPDNAHQSPPRKGDEDFMDYGEPLPTVNLSDMEWCCTKYTGEHTWVSKWPPSSSVRVCYTHQVSLVIDVLFWADLALVSTTSITSVGWPVSPDSKIQKEKQKGGAFI